MATYLLLRNNKEEGPLSLQHLIQLGLKPYDLVWVQGKSAAWRYPSEIPELKPYAAAVEEQPFDRFYKKPGAAKESVETVIHAEPVRLPQVIKQVEPEKKEKLAEIVFPDEVIKKPEIIKENVPEKNENWAGIAFPEENITQPQPEEIKHEKYYPKKTVYVTMPVQQMPEPKQEPVFNIHSSPVTNTREEPVVAQTKYSLPANILLHVLMQSRRITITFMSLSEGPAVLTAAIIVIWIHTVFTNGLHWGHPNLIFHVT